MLLAAAIAILLLDVAALLIIRRKKPRLRSSRSLRRLGWVLWVAGLLLGAAAAIVPWPYDEKTRILGFPLPGTVFELWTNEKGESHWACFPFPWPFLIFDFLLCGYLPQVVLAMVLLMPRSHPSPLAAGDTSLHDSGQVGET